MWLCGLCSFLVLLLLFCYCCYYASVQYCENKWRCNSVRGTLNCNVLFARLHAVHHIFQFAIQKYIAKRLKNRKKIVFFLLFDERHTLQTNELQRTQRTRFRSHTIESTEIQSFNNLQYFSLRSIHFFPCHLLYIQSIWFFLIIFMSCNNKNWLLNWTKSKHFVLDFLFCYFFRPLTQFAFLYNKKKFMFFLLCSEHRRFYLLVSAWKSADIWYWTRAVWWAIRIIIVQFFFRNFVSI